uniref:Uncharacterized protein n=1 Tax=Octopus bimaculoides TaxID=37653 RepID=A0A0L8GCQ4_OCTBM
MAPCLYNATLHERQMPSENIIGFTSNNCSSMTGMKNRVHKLLKDNVFYFHKWIHHSFWIRAMLSCPHRDKI